MRPIAFYAPIKPPDHPIPSGDRLIAANVLKALDIAAMPTELASRFIAYSKRPAGEILIERKRAALEEARLIAQRFAARREQDRPALFLTYHPYCKAPDWIGPHVSAALDIPYITLEAARTGQGFENGGDLWKDWRAEAQAGLRAADMHICFKPTDRAYLTELLGSGERLRDLAPFIDVAALQKMNLPQIDLPGHWRSDQPVIITTGMMRPGKKVENYRRIAEALSGLQHLQWNLVIIGGGPAERTIRGFFERFRNSRLLWTGAIFPEEVAAYMAAGDLFLWPGWHEPIGMVYLEAQAHGLPVAALDSMGVPLVVRNGSTGLLAPENDIGALRDKIATLLSHPALRTDLGEQAKRHVWAEHGLDTAAKSLHTLLVPFLAAG